MAAEVVLQSKGMADTLPASQAKPPVSRAASAPPTPTGRSVQAKENPTPKESADVPRKPKKARLGSGKEGSSSTTEE